MDPAFNVRLLALLERYPYQFRELLDGNLYLRPGWILVFERLCLAVDSILTEPEKSLFYWTQIKEKFGGLRTYWSHSPHYVDIMSTDGVLCLGMPREETDRSLIALAAKVQPWIMAAAKAAGGLCEVCGNRGALRKDRSWWKTLCDRHAALRED